MTKLKKIMCVDDQEDILKIATLSLERVGGFKVKACIGAKAALDEVNKFKPDLILLDVMMPEMDGIEAFIELQKEEFTSNIPVIFLTAKVRANEIVEYIELGALGVISKPFDAMILSEQINQIWDRKNG